MKIHTLFLVVLMLIALVILFYCINKIKRD